MMHQAYLIEPTISEEENSPITINMFVQVTEMNNGQSNNN